MNLYVSNISFHTTEESLEAMFARFGEVKGVKIVTDKNTGITRGFGFVEMAVTDQAMEAIRALDGKEIQGRALRVSQAKDSFAQARKSISQR